MLCAMLASLQQWNPSVPLGVPLLRKATAGSGKFTWTQDLEQEYVNITKVMCEQIRLSPYDKSKTLRLEVDGVSSQVLFFPNTEEKSQKDQVVNASKPYKPLLT